MSEKLTVWVGMVMVAILIPYGLTMLMTGVVGSDKVKDNYRSGLMIEMDEESGVSQKMLDMEDYLIGVLASQMPIDYEKEALKAQAVVLRTNVLRTVKGEKTVQASELPYTYITEEQMHTNWGEKNYENNYNKLKLAVSQTAGLCMKSEGEYIDALYHSVSIGTTASAEELYGKNIPYLISVDSSRDVESKDYMSTSETAYEEVAAKLKENAVVVTPEELKKELTISKKTALGYVKEVKIGDHKISGDDWKKIFALNSTNFYLEDFDGELRTICLGKGSGLGMSQYGANQMAKDGKKHEDILKYYYPGITMYKFTESGNATTRGDVDETR